MQLVVYEFFSCSTNIPQGLSAYNLKALQPHIRPHYYNNHNVNVNTFCKCKHDTFLRKKILQRNEERKNILQSILLLVLKYANFPPFRVSKNLRSPPSISSSRPPNLSTRLLGKNLADQKSPTPTLKS